MTPIPESLQLACPHLGGPYLSYDRVPERPWWICMVLARHLEYVRLLDGARVKWEVGTMSLITSPAGFDAAAFDNLTELPKGGDLVAILDAQSPLPPPGVRAGQVWGRADGETVLLVRGADRPPADYVFLLADPVCPHLAPWSPA